MPARPDPSGAGARRPPGRPRRPVGPPPEPADIPVIPDDFAEDVRLRCGADGERWLRDLPGLLNRYSRRWGLRISAEPFPLSYNYVVAARRHDGTDAVLKLCHPRTVELPLEAAALRHFGPRRAAEVLDADLVGIEEYGGALLLGRVRPGESLVATAAADDLRATSAAAEVMRVLHEAGPPPDGFPSVADWGAGFARHRAAHGGGAGPLPAELFEPAERLFAELLAGSAPPVLLHGDLHHDNILDGGDRWVAIDPKGVTGEPCYEAGALVRNLWQDRYDTPDEAGTLRRRIGLLADELAVDRERLAGWCFAQAVLSAVWLVEDGEDPGDVRAAVRTAGLLHGLLGG
ncbi:aminoglycoside phosphotransferase family protein [Allonocardiopsis opalescens]|uniref:Streptomycin 6-kinase n=1 Tax=Allonocardiopsis opalescens TaxID=1144618 RepID=A0A2T0Q863_9ACTN|nr:aminoglycoside phosphotransferase family protein [Allonocardiopsis opalescens]PRX99933.1 streptomycin 6-kinase [Allonocardiopsis opalescens]